MGASRPSTASRRPSIAARRSRPLRRGVSRPLDPAIGVGIASERVGFFDSTLVCSIAIAALLAVAAVRLPSPLRRPRRGLARGPRLSSSNANWSSKHQYQFSPGSLDLMIGWLVAWKCAVACLFGELSQQPTSPQTMHSRRCTHQPPVRRHSEQPSVLDGVTFRSIVSRCVRLPWSPRRRSSDCEQVGETVCAGSAAGSVGRQPGSAARNDSGSAFSRPISTSPTMRPPTGPRRSPSPTTSASRRM